MHEKRFSIKIVALLLLLVAAGFFTLGFIQQKYGVRKFIPFDNVASGKWDTDFKEIEITSSIDGSIQKAFFYNSSSSAPSPLVISLHTWSGDYAQDDKIKDEIKNKGWNYIHPNFRGPNNTPEACGSPLVISDIDDAIEYAISHSNVDLSKIYVVGTSGGGHATLAAFMKSKYNIAQFSAWCPISDIGAWYKESKIRKSNYAKDILKCTESTTKNFNLYEAKLRSPLWWETPVEKLHTSKLKLYAGVYDGVDGSVPMIHSINFYNKILSDMDCKVKEAYISDKEKVELMGNLRPVGKFGFIGKRQIFLKKEYKNVSIIIFEGGHEMLTDVVVGTL